MTIGFRGFSQLPLSHCVVSLCSSSACTLHVAGTCFDSEALTQRVFLGHSRISISGRHVKECAANRMRVDERQKPLRKFHNVSHAERDEWCRDDLMCYSLSLHVIA